MDWQTWVSLGIVAVAGLVVLVQLMRPWLGSPRDGCGTGCTACPAGSGSKDGLKRVPLVDLGSADDRIPRASKRRD